MNRLFFVFPVLITASSIGWATLPCAPIAEACIKAGYYKGGNIVGKGLVDNCVKPVLKRQKNLPGITFSENTLQQCEKQLEEIMKQSQASHK